MPDFPLIRRDLLLGAGAAAAALAAASPATAQGDPAGSAPTPDQQRRMAWWHQAKFGMFIHFGLYSGHQRHEWAMENEAIRSGNMSLSPRCTNQRRKPLAPGRDWPRRRA